MVSSVFPFQKLLSYRLRSSDFIDFFVFFTIFANKFVILLGKSLLQYEHKNLDRSISNLLSFPIFSDNLFTLSTSSSSERF